MSDCIVSPDVFHQMVDRLGEFVVPYQRALETEAGQRNVHLYLQGLLSHLPGKNAEDIATFVDIERQVLQAFIGTAPWDHRPLIEVLVPQVVHRLGQPDGILAFDPSSFPKRGRVPAGCGYGFGTFPKPSERGQSAGDHHSKPVFKTPSMSLGLHLSTLSPSTPRSSTGILF